MQVTFPAMRGRIGGRIYYSTIMALSEIPRFFRFNDWEQIPAELRAQRVLNESRVPAITKYIVDNENSYLFSAITASYATDDISYEPGASIQPDIGTVQLDLEDTEFVINDGQHRCAAIAQALKENPKLAKDRISVLLFPSESNDRMQQMFSDLNRFAQRPSKSINILYDHRDALAALTNVVVEKVDVFRGRVDMERVSIPIRSDKLFALSTIYDANKELLGNKIEPVGSEPFEKTCYRAAEYWDELAKVMKDWEKVAQGLVPPAAVRQEKISTHATVLRALGGVGRILQERYPDEWREHLNQLASVDWRKSVGGKVNPQWDGVCISAGSVLGNRQARLATLASLCSAAKVAAKDIPGSRRRGRPRKTEGMKD